MTLLPWRHVGHSSPLWNCALDLATVLAFALVGVAVVAARLLAFSVALWALESTLDLRLGFASVRALVLVGVTVAAALRLALSATLWAFESALHLHFGIAPTLAPALVGVAVVAALLMALFMTPCASQSTLDWRLDLHQRWLMPWSVSQVTVEQFGRSL
jgi:hypothetical protein